MTAPRTLAGPVLLLLLGSAGCDGAAPVVAVPASGHSRSGDDAGTGWDFELDQTDIPPETDPLLRDPERYLPVPLDAGVLSLVDAAVLEPPVDGGTPLSALDRDAADDLCALAIAHADMQATPEAYGQAACLYELASLQGFEAATECEGALGMVGDCMLSAPLLCGELGGCDARVATFTECARELGALRAAFAALFDSCAVFDRAPEDTQPGAALAGRPLACDALQEDCPGALLSP